MNKIAEFAKEQGYDNAVYIGRWKEYDVYEPVTDQEETAYTGVPLVILVQGDTVRMSTVDEAYAQLDSMID